MDKGLKPCPFCGGKAQTEYYLFSWSIYCDCGAQMTICGDGKDEGKYIMDVWNRRENPICNYCDCRTCANIGDCGNACEDCEKHIFTCKRYVKGGVK